MGRRSYSGTAVPTVLSGGIGALDLLFTVQDATGYPDGSGGPFYVTLARGVAGEEKILCDSRSGPTFTVNTAGRGADGTVATSHAASSTTVEHTITKTDLDEANRHVNQTAGADNPHPQYIKTTDANAAYVARASIESATVLAGEGTTSTAYTDLVTVGPSVTVDIGPSGRALVIISLDASNNTAGQFALASHAISGATASVATDDWELVGGGTAGIPGTPSRTVIRENLTPGSNTFTAKYRATGGTASFSRRNLTVIPL